MKRFFPLLLLFAAPFSHATAAVVQAKCSQSGSATSVSTTLTSNATVGHMLAVVVSYQNTGTNTGVTDNNTPGDTFAVDQAEFNMASSSNLKYLKWWSTTVGGAGGFAQVTASFSGGAQGVEICVAEISGETAFDVGTTTTAAPASATQAYSGYITTTDCDVVLGYFHGANNVSWTVFSTFTSGATAPSTNSLLEYEVQTAPGTVNAVAQNASAASGYGASISTYKGAGCSAVTFGDVKSIKNSGSAASPATVTCAITGVTAGHHLILDVVTSASGTVVSSCSDGSAFTRVANRNFLTGVGGGEIWLRENVGSGTHTTTCTATGSGTINWGCALHEVAGLKSSGSFDKTAAATGTSTTPSSGNTATLSQADEYVHGFFHPQHDATNVGSGYTAGQLDAFRFVSEYKIVAATTAVAADGTQASSGGWGVEVATFMKSSGGGGGGTAVKVIVKGWK